MHNKHKLQILKSIILKRIKLRIEKSIPNQIKRLYQYILSGSITSVCKNGLSGNPPSVSY